MGMTPKERLLTAVNGKEPDHIPVHLLFGPVYFNKWARSVGREIGKDLTSKLETELEFFQQWPEIVPLIDGPPGQGAVGLRAWLDRRILRSGMQPPSLHWSIEKVKDKLKKAKAPDPHKDGWMPQSLEDWQMYIDHLPSEARSRYGELVWTFQVPGPLVSVGTLLSYPDVFRLLSEDPDFVHELLNFHTLSTVPWIRAVEQVFIRSGLKPCRLFIEEEILPMLSRDHAEAFCLPYLKALFEASQAAIKVFHCDNRVTHMGDVVTGLGANVFFGNFSDYAVLKEAFNSKMALMGNVPSLHVLTRGNPEDVEACSKWLMAKCGPGGGFILSSGGGLDPAGNTPLENINAMVGAAKKYGRYPLNISMEKAPYQYQSIMSLHFARSAGEGPAEKASQVDEIAEQTCAGNDAAVERKVKEVLEAGVAPRRVFEALCRGLRMAVDLFYIEKYFHPEMEGADGAYRSGLASLGPAFKAGFYKGTVVIGSMKGSIQESGIRLIEVMLRGAGLKVVNLGAGVGPERFVDEAVKEKARVIAMGVYFYKHATLAEQVTRKLRKRGLDIKTLVGGMGITPEVARDLDVDAYAADGRQAVEKVLALISSS